MLEKILNFKFHLRPIFAPYYRYLSNHFHSELCINQTKREIPIILSLTSYEDRFNDLEITLYSIMNQTVKPDKIILWLSDKLNLLELPYSITRYVKNGLEIRFVKDIKSYTKIIYALKEFNNSIIVTADDDIYYPKDWLEKLYESYIVNPEDIQVHRAHRADLNKPYEMWQKHVEEEKASFDNFLTGVGGVLYPPNCFTREVYREDLFLKYAPNADDIWLWIMALLSNRKIRVVKNHIHFLKVIDYLGQIGLKFKQKLYLKNYRGENDKQLQALIKLYGNNIGVNSKGEIYF